MTFSDAIVIDPSVLNNPWILWALVATGFLAILFGFFRRESGQFGEWLAKMRRAAEERDDLRVSSLRKDINLLIERDNQKAEAIKRLEGQVRNITTERDGLVNYLREWWNWALLGANGEPPPVPETLKGLLPPASWTWRPGYSNQYHRHHPEGEREGSSQFGSEPFGNRPGEGDRAP